MGLRTFIGKRIIFSFILLLLVMTLNFVIFMVMPGDPVSLFVNPVRGSQEGRAEMIARIKAIWGLDKPIEIRFLTYIQNMLTWNFGVSQMTRNPVGGEMTYRLPFTLILMGGSSVLAIVAGVFLGVLVAHKRGGKFDSSMVLTSLVFYSLPTFWMGMIFILIFYTSLGWLPHAHAFPPPWTLPGNWPNPLTIATSTQSTQTFNIVFSVNPAEMLRLVSGYVTHSILPVLTLTLFQYGGYLLLTRATMLEALTEDYIVTARAKGVKETSVLYRHALKNASLPLITSAALAFGFMLSGAIITESVYSWPGLGGWIWDSIQYQDYAVLQAIFYIIALCVIIANFVSDLLYGVIDPRIKYG